jgi:two-component system, sensor histidine kinase and response regulator
MNASHDLVDEAVLAELQASVGGDRAFVLELIDAYVSDGAAYIDAIATAIAATDADALVRPAHTLKSSSATLGATRMAAIARELEMIGRAGTVDASAAGLLAGVRSAWPATGDALRGWADREAGG